MRDAIQEQKLPYEQLLLDKLEARFMTQSQPIHWAAKALDPSNCGASRDYSQVIMTSVLKFFQTHVSTEDWPDFNRQFSAFRRQDTLLSEPILWSVKHDPIARWELAGNYAPELSQLAIRLWLCPANSMPSERAFSVANYVQDRFRSNLSTERTSDLIYVYMNTGTLRRTTEMQRKQGDRLQLRKVRLDTVWKVRSNEY